jgi:hypothetical protein
MANETLIDAIDWKTYEVAAGLASGYMPVRIGTAGNGGPVGVLTASVHGDEGHGAQLRSAARLPARW